MSNFNKNIHNIYLTGFMGSGKTTIGRLLALQLNLPFVDTDRQIARLADKTVSAIFLQDGESKFRQLEHEIILRLSKETGKVAALGGGAVISKENRLIIAKTGISIYLCYSSETITARLLNNTSRPLLQEDNPKSKGHKIIEMLGDRKKYYETADILLQLQNETPEQVCQKIISRMEIKNV